MNGNYDKNMTNTINLCVLCVGDYVFVHVHTNI